MANHQSNIERSRICLTAFSHGQLAKANRRRRQGSCCPASSTFTTIYECIETTLLPKRKSRRDTTMWLARRDSPWPIAPWLKAREANPASLNIALMVGHATIREQVMGKDFQRVATSAEVEKMVQFVDQGMTEGAIGLSSGLEYEVGSYSATDEVVAMSAAAAKSGGFYMTHIRDEADKAFDALKKKSPSASVRTFQSSTRTSS